MENLFYLFHLFLVITQARIFKLGMQVGLETLHHEIETWSLAAMIHNTVKSFNNSCSTHYLSLRFICSD